MRYRREQFSFRLFHPWCSCPLRARSRQSRCFQDMQHEKREVRRFDIEASHDMAARGNTQPACHARHFRPNQQRHRPERAGRGENPRRPDSRTACPRRMQRRQAENRSSTVARNTGAHALALSRPSMKQSSALQRSNVTRQKSTQEMPTTGQSACPVRCSAHATDRHKPRSEKKLRRPQSHAALKFCVSAGVTKANVTQ
jgi:hypothetical protein